MAPGSKRLYRALTIVLISGGACSGTLEVGDTVPDLLTACMPRGSICDRDAAVSVVWLFTTEDCLKCLDFPSVLRDTWRRHGADAFAFEAVHVRDSGESGEWLPRFFMKERLTPRIRSIDRQRFGREFGDLPLPALLVIAKGKVQSISTGEPQELGVLAGLIRSDSAFRGGDLR